MGVADDFTTTLYAFMGAIRRRFYSRQILTYPGDLLPCRNGHEIAQTLRWVSLARRVIAPAGDLAIGLDGQPVKRTGSNAHHAVEIRR